VPKIPSGNFFMVLGIIFADWGGGKLAKGFLLRQRADFCAKLSTLSRLEER